MQSPATYKNKANSYLSGFTLIEVLITLSIIGFVFAMGATVNMDFYMRGAINKEQSILIAVLQKARNRSMNNIHASAHGVHIEGDSFIIYREFPYLAGRATNEIVPRSDNIIVSGLNDVVFTQLSGEPNQYGDIVLSDAVRTKTISVIKGGLIDW